MSTRSYIGYSEDLFGTNTARCIYCQFDGYLEGVGTTLYKNYNSEELADKLTSKGNLDSLRESIEKNDYYDENDEPFICKFASRNKEVRDDVYFGIDYRYVFDRKTQKWWLVEKTRFYGFPAYIPLEAVLISTGIINSDLT